MWSAFHTRHLPDWTHLYSVEYHDIDPAQEREIFQRVQLGMTLTAAGSFPLSIKDRGHLTALQRNFKLFHRHMQSKLSIID